MLWSWIHVIHVLGFLVFYIFKSEISLLSVGATSMDPWDVGPRPMHALKHKMQSFNGTTGF